ncbi:glycolate oxidase [Anseongella ginsenosidimutans]|uniref:Glycolate oxidase n=1 Tax=Anseongella ginsenosidimutans TaxID=496056 RepID=A0A4R3KU86_9SPHI|nr:FAD-binding oxidoreductase [Anseongella ginsenosidimutans]QEC53248.1 FAD-binding oxidoreductase [Anseongella ginsenosidimutans]TCS87885.1 glycolate oxidase [Anseongella ginsenosidimutans]
MNYQPLQPETINKLQEIVGTAHVLYDPETLTNYSHDETEDLSFLPEAVIRPGTAAEVSAILKCCNQYLIPVTPRGAGTSLSGSALPVHGGLVLSLERMNRIIDIDERNLQATVEPGVITQVLMDAAAEKGFLYPVDPASRGSCFIGGNIAHGSGGPRVVKYGTIRDYILNLEVVLPSGEIIQTGANTLKNASGYSLTQLMIGSEGTLGIVTKAVLKLIPKPTHSLVMLASFFSNEAACQAVSAIFRAGIIPSALEFMERAGVEWVLEYETLDFEAKEGVQAYLLIEVDGREPEQLFADCEKIAGVLEAFGSGDVLLAESAAQKEALWKIRHTMPHSIKANSVYKEEDTVVPRAELPALIKGIKAIGDQYGFRSVCYGHAGDGNLHVNIIKAGMNDEDWKNKLRLGIREIFQLTASLGGTLSGEHGIGYVQREFMDVIYPPAHLELLRAIKKAFDPNNILNPGKILL